MRGTIPHKTRLYLMVWALALPAACDASFVDQRQVSGADSLAADRLAGGTDIGPPGDGPAATIATGPFEGRGGYGASGNALLTRRPDGRFELLFDEAFESSSVPGPVVLLSTREKIGPEIRDDDIHLGRLRSASGEQRYELPGDPGERRWAWVYCEPFGVEVARAQMVEVADR